MSVYLYNLSALFITTLTTVHINNVPATQRTPKPVQFSPTLWAKVLQFHYIF